MVTRSIARPIYRALGSLPDALSAELVSRAEAIIAAADAYSYPGDLASAPTVSVGTTGANSTLNSASVNSPTYSIDNAAHVWRMGPLAAYSGNEAFGWTGAWVTKSGTRSPGGAGIAYSFQATNLTAFDIMMTGNAARVFRVRVNGSWAHADQTVNFSGRAYVKVTFASPVSGTIDICLDALTPIKGVNIDGGATWGGPANPVLMASIFGDSYTQGNSGWTIRGTPAQRFGEKMGIQNIVPHGASGQGYATLVDGEYIHTRIAKDAGYIQDQLGRDDPHFVVAYGSVNDRGGDTATIAANIATGIQSLQSAYPDSWVIFFASFNTTAGTPFSSADIAAFKAEADGVADARTLVIDTTDWEEVSQTGTLPGGYGSHDSPDGVHPGPNETEYLTDLMVSSAVAALEAAIG